MELKCVLVLALVPLVTASPHGYGVKGGPDGAAAKAEAAAGAGAFAGIPLAIPSGEGYTGSFAKSSSSSFATSSASSSASSFSFSGSGTVGASANGLSGARENSAGTEGCSGNCKSGNNVILDTSGAGSNNQAYSGAKAAAGAGAVAISSAPYGKNDYQAPCPNGDCRNQISPNCGGSSCGDTTNNSEKCTSGKCETASQAIATTDKCSSKQCSPFPSENASSYDADDIQVNVASNSPKTIQNSNDQPKKYYKKPSDYEHSQLSPSAPNKPTTYLTTPKEDTPCTSPGCAPISSSPGGVYDKEKPSSYNVPIFGPNYAPSLQNTVPCSTGNCKNDQSSSPHTNLPSGPSGSGSICASGSCQNYPNQQINPESPGLPSGYKPDKLSLSGVPPAVASNGAKNPNYAQPIVPSTSAFGKSGTATIASNGAKNPNYAQPIVPSTSAFGNSGAAASSNTVGNYGAAKPTTASSDKKLPPYTGGFGGPAGILKPNDFSAPNQIHVSSYKPVQSTAPTASVSCTSGNCAARPTKPEANLPTCSNGNCGGPQFPVSSSGNLGIQHPNQPSACSSGNCGVSPGSSSIQNSSPSFNRPSTPIFGGPSGILKPNDYSKPGPKPTPTQGSYNPPSFPSIHYGQTNDPINKPIETPICTYGNCGVQASSSGAHGISGPLKPNTQTPSVGFVGPSGILKSNDFNKPLTPSYKPLPAMAGNYNPPGLSSPQYDQPKKLNTSQYKTEGPSGSTPCSSSDCEYQLSQPQLGSAATAQTYSTLCGSGKCESKPTQTSTVAAGPYNPVYCTSGNCKTNQFPPVPSTPLNPSSSTLNQPEISRSYHSTYQSKPSSSNYGLSHPPNQIHSSTGTATPGSFNPSCSSGKCSHEQPSPQYDSTDSKPASSANTYIPQPCPAGNCGSQNKIPNIPSTSAGTFPSASCSSGNCGVNSVPGHSTSHYNQPGSTNIAIGAVASAGAVAYTGGFGGPPGLLKPYDGGKLSSLPAGFGPNPKGSALYGPASQSSYGKSITGIGSSQSGVGAQASAIAGATAGSYGGHGNQGSNNGQGNGKGGCISGCESQGGENFGHNSGLGGFGALSAAGASAKSVAGAFGGGGAGTYGQAGSFASSSATAHTSAGAATKGGYGRR